MENSKLDLSPHGFRLLTEREPWDERKAMTAALFDWFGAALAETKRRHGKLFDALTNQTLNGKITRGDNYNGYPYILLDYPNVFSRDEILAVRNLIWFGNGFYSTLHLRGSFANDVLQKLHSRQTNFRQGVFVCTSPDEWLHHVDTDRWKPVEQINDADKARVLEQRWIKLGMILPFRHPDLWHDALIECYDCWAAVLSNRQV